MKMERIAEARHPEWPISTLTPCHEIEKKNGEHPEKQVLFYVTVIEDVRRRMIPLSRNRADYCYELINSNKCYSKIVKISKKLCN